MQFHLRLELKCIDWLLGRVCAALCVQRSNALPAKISHPITHYQEGGGGLAGEQGWRVYLRCFSHSVHDEKLRGGYKITPLHGLITFESIIFGL